MSRRACTKRRYKDALAARLALAVIQRKDDGRHVEQRVYYCTECRSHHLTSQTVGQHKRAKAKARLMADRERNR